MIILLTAALAASASPEAERLGRELASTGALETILPAVAAKETAEVIADHPELSAEDRDALRATALTVVARERERLIGAFGHVYASTLSLADLRALAAFNRTAAARHYRQVMPHVTMQALAGIGNLDFKGDLARAFCERTGKWCSSR